MPGRAVKNAFIREEESRNEGQEKQSEEGIERRKNWKCYQCLEKCNPAEIPYCITRALINAVKGNVEQGLIFCGTNAYRAKKLEHVSEIMEEFKISARGCRTNINYNL